MPTNFSPSIVTASLTVQELQAVNEERAKRWHNGDISEWSIAEWTNAMCGEAGEAANVAKKLIRIRDSLTGNQYSEHPAAEASAVDILLNKLGEELADTVIYACLCASRVDLDMAQLIRDKFNKKSREMGFVERL